MQKTEELGEVCLARKYLASRIAIKAACSSETLSLVNKTKPRNTESFRRTIMKQEEIFRYQVHELHRLYRVQKSLMPEKIQPDQKFNSYFECLQRIAQDKEILSSNYRTSRSTSGTSRHKQYYDIHSDSESNDIDLSLALGLGIKSRPKSDRQEFNHTKSKSTDVPWLYQSSS